jgi:hypothetical protein
MHVINFDGEHARRVTLCIGGRSQPRSSDYWDGNWLVCAADVSIATYEGRIQNLIRNEDLIRFSNSLNLLSALSAGQALLDTLDGWLDVQIVRDDPLPLVARFLLVTNPASADSLDFELELKPDSLCKILEDLRKIKDDFPVVGERTV